MILSLLGKTRKLGRNLLHLIDFAFQISGQSIELLSGSDCIVEDSSIIDCEKFAVVANGIWQYFRQLL